MSNRRPQQHPCEQAPERTSCRLFFPSMYAPKQLEAKTNVPFISAAFKERSPSRGDSVSCRLPLASFHRFRLRARLGPPWPTEVSPLTDPTVQISRSGFLKQDSPFSKSA